MTAIVPPELRATGLAAFLLPSGDSVALSVMLEAGLSLTSSALLLLMQLVQV